MCPTLDLFLRKYNDTTHVIQNEFMFYYIPGNLEVVRYHQCKHDMFRVFLNTGRESNPLLCVCIYNFILKHKIEVVIEFPRSWFLIIEKNFNEGTKRVLTFKKTRAQPHLSTVSNMFCGVYRPRGIYFSDEDDSGYESERTSDGSSMSRQDILHASRHLDGPL